MATGKNERKKISKKLATLITIVIVVLSSVFGIDLLGDESSEIGSVEGELIVHVIDCGQADSILFIQGDKTALVDCGTRSTGKDVVTYIKTLGINRLDYVIGTHPHDDHMGGMYDVITNFEIGKIIISSGKPESTTNWYTKLMSELKTGKYDIHYAKQEDSFNLGEAIMQVLAAETEVKGNTNNYSIVMKVSFGQNDIIMTGDAETEIEEKILESGANIDAEILKIGHHGSNTSTSDEFLDEVSPKYALISCEVGNKHNHPTKDTMDKLKARNIEVHRTDECSTIIVTITSDTISFECDPGDYLSGSELEERSLP